MQKPAEDTGERGYHRKEQNNTVALGQPEIGESELYLLGHFVLCLKGSEKVEATDKRWIMELRCPEGGSR